MGMRPTQLVLLVVPTAGAELAGQLAVGYLTALPADAATFSDGIRLSGDGAEPATHLAAVSGFEDPAVAQLPGLAAQVDGSWYESFPLGAKSRVIRARLLDAGLVTISPPAG